MSCLSRSLALFALLAAPLARADDDAQFKAEMRHFAHILGKTAKEAGKVAVHATNKAVQKTDQKLSHSDRSKNDDK